MNVASATRKTPSPASGIEGRGEGNGHGESDDHYPNGAIAVTVRIFAA